eukprot:5479011-Alexandrium_andersonii.AAC.1
MDESNRCENVPVTPHCGRLSLPGWVGSEGHGLGETGYRAPRCRCGGTQAGSGRASARAAASRAARCANEKYSENAHIRM